MSCPGAWMMLVSLNRTDLLPKNMTGIYRGPRAPPGPPGGGARAARARAAPGRPSQPPVTPRVAALDARRAPRAPRLGVYTRRDRVTRTVKAVLCPL